MSREDRSQIRSQNPLVGERLVARRKRGGGLVDRGSRECYCCSMPSRALDGGRRSTGRSLQGERSAAPPAGPSRSAPEFSMSTPRVVHYLNQFFAGIGAEAEAD